MRIIEMKTVAEMGALYDVHHAEEVDKEGRRFYLRN